MHYIDSRHHNMWFRRFCFLQTVINTPIETKKTVQNTIKCECFYRSSSYEQYAHKSRIKLKVNIFLTHSSCYQFYSSIWYTTPLSSLENEKNIYEVNDQTIRRICEIPCELIFIYSPVHSPRYYLQIKAYTPSTSAEKWNCLTKSRYIDRIELNTMTSRVLLKNILNKLFVGADMQNQ